MSFRAAGEHIAIDLPGGTALFTTRHGGVSEGPYASLNLGSHTDDDPARGRGQPRRAPRTSRGAPLARRAPGPRHHGRRGRRRRRSPDADGQVTAAPGLAPLVLVADCLPVALVSAAGVGVVHAGWRGLHGGILAAGVRALRDLGATDVAAAIGPGDRRLLLRGRRRAARGVRHDASRRSTCPASPPAQLAAAGVGDVHDGRPVHGLRRARRRAAVLLPPPRPRRHGTPGGDRMAELIRGLDAARIARNLEQVREEIGRDGVEILAAVKYVALEELGTLAEAGHHARGGEPRPGARGQARRLRRRVHLGLHRAAAEPQGQDRAAARALRAVGRAPTPRWRSWRSTAPRRPRSSSRSTSPGRRARRASRRPTLGDFIARSPAKVVGLMTMPPLRREPRGQPPLVRRAGPAGRRPRAVRSCRWAPRRTSPSRPRKGPRSCA